MNLKTITPANLVSIAKLIVFFLMGFFRYKRVAFTALIVKPLRITGRKYISLSKNVRINKYAWLLALKIDGQDPELTIGEGCSFGDFNHIAAVRKVIFGKQVLTANGVYVSDNLHGYENIHVPVMHQPVMFKAEVSIGDGSWLGEHVCVIGARIGKHCVIGANSVVTEDIPDYSVAVGAPARVTKRYNFQTNRWDRAPQCNDAIGGERLDERAQAGQRE